MAIQHIGAGTEEASTPDSSGCGSGPNASKPLLNGHRNGIEHVEHAVSNLSTPSPTSDHSTTGHKTPESHKSNESGYRPRYPRRADRIDQAITAKNAQCFFDHTCSIFVGNLSTKEELAIIEAGLVEVFSKFGQCWVKVKEGRLKILPGAFVVFDNPKSAQRAIEHDPEIILHGRILRVEPANCKRDAIIGHRSREPFTTQDIDYALPSDVWGSIEKVIIEQSLTQDGLLLQEGRVTFAFLGDYEEAIKDYSDPDFYLKPPMDPQDSQGNQARRANNPMGSRGNSQRYNSNGYNNRPRGGRHFATRGGNARNNYGRGNRYFNGNGNYQNFNGPISPNGYHGRGFTNDSPPVGFPVNNFPNTHFHTHGYSNGGGFHQNNPNNFQGYPNQALPAPGSFPAAQSMVFNPQMQFQEGPVAPYYATEPFPPVYPFMMPNQPGFSPQPPLPQNMQLANGGPVPGSFLPPITTGPLIISSQPIYDIQPHQHSPPHGPISYMANNAYTGLQNDWHSPSAGYGAQHEYAHSQPTNNLPGLHPETAGSRRSSSDSTTPSTPKEKRSERPKRQIQINDSGATSELLGDAENEDNMQTAVSEPVQGLNATVVEVAAEDEVQNPKEETTQLPTAAPNVDQVADRKGKSVLRSITPVDRESKLMPIIPLHAKTTAYGDGKPANLNSPAKSPVKTEAPAFTPTDTSIKTPPTQAESSGSATPTTLTPIESRKPAAPKTPSKAEPQRTVPKYSATASSWRSAAPTSVESHKPKSVPAPLPPSTSTNSRSQDPATSSFLPTADPRENYPFNLSKKPPAPALARDDVNGKGKAPETEQGEDGEAVKEEEEENAPEQSAKTGEELHAEESLRLEEELQMDALIRERFANRTPLPQDFMPKEYAMVDMIMEEATEREINLDEAWLLAFIMEMEDEQRKKYADDEHVDANDTSEDNANRETITLETSNEGNTNDDNSPPATPALTNGPSASSRDEDEPIDIWTEEWTDHN